jgi:hypothetical protein
MTITQTWGWLAAGVLALGLNGIYHDGGAEWTRRTVSRVIDQVSERTEPILALASGRAELFLAKSRTVVVRQETASCRFARSVARIQSRMALQRAGFDQVRAIADREEAQFARLQADRARIESQVARVRFSPVSFETVRVPAVCPRVRVRVRVNEPRVSIPSIPAPEVSAEMTGAGPI